MFGASDNKEKEPKEVKNDEEEDSGEDEDVEKEVTGNWKIVDLPELPKVTGEEEEDEVTKFRSKVYRFRKGEWKERGVGDLRLMKHKATNYIRVLVRNEKIHKCVMNHYIMRKDIFCELVNLPTGKNTWTWAAYDISDEEPASEKFAVRFTSKEEYDRFEEEFKKAIAHNDGLKGEKKEEATQESEAKKEEKAE